MGRNRENWVLGIRSSFGFLFRTPGMFATIALWGYRFGNALFRDLKDFLYGGGRN